MTGRMTVICVPARGCVAGPLAGHVAGFVVESVGIGRETHLGARRGQDADGLKARRRDTWRETAGGCGIDAHHGVSEAMMRRMRDVAVPG